MLLQRQIPHQFHAEMADDFISEFRNIYMQDVFLRKVSQYFLFLVQSPFVKVSLKNKLKLFWWNSGDDDVDIDKYFAGVLYNESSFG